MKSIKHMLLHYYIQIQYYNNIQSVSGFYEQTSWDSRIHQKKRFLLRNSCPSTHF